MENWLYNIKSDINRAVCSRKFAAGVIGVITVIAFASIGEITEIINAEEPLENGFHAKFILGALQSDAFALTLPIFAALPFTTAFLDDIKSGFIKQYLSRTSRKRYIVGKLAACGFSGGLLLFAGIMIAFLISALVFASTELAITAESNAENAFVPFHWVDVVKKAFLLSFSGMFWSLTGFVCASLTMNRYMAYVSPFILYYILIILHERYFPSLYMFYPREWIFPEREWLFDNIGVIALIMLLTLIVGLSFALFAERRLKNV